jgi:hypothetical protein
MKANVGGADRVIRIIIIGLALLSLLFILPAPTKWWGLVGIVPLLTAFMSFCPLYSIIGVDTCPVKRT